MFMKNKFRVLFKFKCPILKCVIRPCVVHNFSTGVLFCNNENKKYDVSREKRMCTIYLYILRRIIHNEVFFKIFSEKRNETR